MAFCFEMLHECWNFQAKELAKHANNKVAKHLASPNKGNMANLASDLEQFVSNHSISQTALFAAMFAIQAIKTKEIEGTEKYTGLSGFRVFFFTYFS